MSMKPPNALASAGGEEALPRELILSIQRVLDLHPGPDTNSLDDFSDNFSPISVVNEFFPDGTFWSTFYAIVRSEVV
jgi:vacuolar protein sorting-associated protein 53